MNPVPAVIYYQHCLKARRMRQICQKPEERWNKWEGNQYLCSSGLHCPDHSCGEHLQQAKPSCLEHHCPAVTVVHQLADRLQGHSITWKKRVWDEGNASTINHRNPKQQCCSPGLCSARLDCSPRVFHNPWRGSRPFCIRCCVLTSDRVSDPRDFLRKSSWIKNRSCF